MHDFSYSTAAQRVLFEGNVLENSWVDGQIGFAVVLWSVNPYGSCTWCGTRDVTIRYNEIRNAAGGFRRARGTARDGSREAINRPVPWVRSS